MSVLTGKVAAVTGAGSGIGRATALALARHGAKVVVATHRKESADRVVSEIAAAGGTAVGVFGDVADEGVAKAIADTAMEAYGRLDLLHNNAALVDAELMARDATIVDLEREIWRRVLDVNLIGPALCSKHAIPHMVRQGGGAIIMSGSGRSEHGDLSNHAYGASKAGLVNLAKSIATMHGRDGIRCNILIVGVIMTETAEAALPQDMQDLLAAQNLTPFLGAASDVAATVTFLASDEARYITGAEIPVDGGLLAHSPLYSDLRRMQTPSGS